MNQLTSVKTSSSVAIGDWIVVMSEILTVTMNIKVQTETQMRTPRIVDSPSSLNLSVRESGDTSRGSGVCLFKTVKVLGDAERRAVLSECVPFDAMAKLPVYSVPAIQNIQGILIKN